MDGFSLLIAGLLLTAVAISAYAFLSGAGARRLARRARRLGQPDQGGRKGPGPQLRRNQERRFDSVLAGLLPNEAKFRQRLAATGTDITISQYLMMSGAVAVVALVLGLLGGAPLLVMVIATPAAGLLLPHLAVGFLVGRRRKKFSKAFPDAIGLMVRGLKAGLPASEGVAVVGREAIGPLGEEFRRASDQIRLGQSLEDAMWAVARRVGVQEFNFLVITLGIQRETGGNLGETLENLDDMLRKRAQMKLKVKAMSSEAMATAMIIGCLPFVMALLLFFVAHAYIMTLFTTPMGNLLLGGGLTWLSIGAFIMMQMVRFEV